MNEFMVMMLGWIGIYAPMVLATIGSIYGCAIAGQAAIGAMLDTEGEYGKYIGVSVLPSTHAILGIVIMFTLKRDVTPEVASGLFAIGILAGIGLLLCGIQQGLCCASAINAAKSKPEIFSLSITPAAIVEGFAVFIFVFALMLIGAL
jgi:V/A-type H+-transporting ATPase subunit K